MISDKRAVYLGCFIHAALYMPVRVGGEDGVQYVTTQVEGVLTRMHSSRMRTVRSSGRRSEGRIPACPGQGGCVSSMHWAAGVCPGGCLPRGLSAQGCLHGG